MPRGYRDLTGSFADLERKKKFPSGNSKKVHCCQAWQTFSYALAVALSSPGGDKQLRKTSELWFSTINQPTN